MKIYKLLNGRSRVRLSNVAPMRHERGALEPHCKTNDLSISKTLTFTIHIQ